MATPNAVLVSVLEEVNSLLEGPEIFICPQASSATSISSKVKGLYDFVKECEPEKESASDALPELITEGFDDEQIWQELELQNAFVISKLIKDCSQCLLSHDDGFGAIASSTASDASNQPAKDDDKTDPESAEDDLGDAASSEGDGEYSEAKKSADDIAMTTGSSVKASVVDDQFFKLAEMEKFLEQEDAVFEKEQRQSKKQDSDDDTDTDLESDDSDANFMYDDFFVAGKKKPPTKAKKGVTWNDKEAEGSMDEEGLFDDEEEEGDAELMGRARQLLEDSEDEEGEDVKGDMEDEDNGADKPVQKSAFQKRTEQQKKKIAELEEANLADKPWQLLGEVSASRRPENSLLEEAVEFDVATAPAPLITQETTQKLEDIIVQRIKDKAYDDVERKEKGVKEAAEYKKRIVLDQEKSKQSLSQIYEQEYLKKVQGENEEVKEDPKHVEIAKMMTALFSKLDALSNFHFTPKPAIPEIKIVSNLPALTMEEATPVTATEASQLAPEEVKRPTAHLQSKAERSDTDKKRERRQKKALGRAKRLAALAREDQLAVAAKAKPTASGDKLIQKRALNSLTKVEKSGGNVTVLKMDEKKKGRMVKSSAHFFKQLQEQTTEFVKSKKTATKRLKSVDKPSAKKLKL